MPSVSAIDSRTAEALREAVAAASAGRTKDACQIAERALANGGEAAALNALLGTLHLRNGDRDAGIEYLRQANAARPSDPVIAFNLASALGEREEYASALEVISNDLARADSTMRLERLRGFLAQSAEHFEDAITSYERIVAAATD